jgi:exopolyphosphatase / guanosine-5'-triphosphate,3'-diphosphate pyrophosphatase
MNRKIAIIDMGTNTFHLMVAVLDEYGFKILLKEKVAVRLGKGGISHGVITAEAQERALKTLKAFKKIIDKEKVSATYATGTSAMRMAKNGHELADKIYKETSIQVRIISGEEEAELIYYGVKKALKIGDSTNLIMDIGGGSVEFIICNHNAIFWVGSFEIGAQRMLDLYHQSDPIEKGEIEKLNSYLEIQLAKLFVAVKKYKPKTLIGCSGTFDTLSDIHRLKKGILKYIDETELPLNKASFDEIYVELINKTREERLAMPGMIEMRVDMIVVACCLIRFILMKTSIKKLRASAYALKEGVLLHTVNMEQSKIILRN